MKHTIFFINKNPEWNQELADRRYKGEESERNLYILWEDEIDIEGEPMSFEVLEDETFTVRAEKDGSPIEIKVPETTVFRYNYADGNSTDLAVSSSIVEEIDRRRINNEEVVYVYMKAEKEIFRPYAGLYLEEEPEL
ncbi:hypothetical protein [Salibacter halophilus]|uniref:Uncharacterized protein n=1 Tax=Salibacter halophilus TaxID=1803916 RepID=A0A6N6MCL8_9FLAO|nr:hypothetical protein [Salibacter halophilus]KAB1066263.1 hypothetical protein F3059_01950 [Salibacter halophilus]